MRIQVTDPETDFRGFVVIDDTVENRAMGGTRMTADVDIEEVEALAGAMTSKLALAGLSIGGAKAGIVCGLPPGPQRDRQLAAFGRAVAPLLHSGIYLGCDQGISYRDRELFFNAAAFDLRRDGRVDLPCSWNELWERCHEATGFGVCEAVVEAATQIGPGVTGGAVSIQGFGIVGRAVASGLAARGFRIVAVADRDGTIMSATGLPVEELVSITDESGTIDRTRLPAGLLVDPTAEAWLHVDADILVLAASRDAVTRRNVDRVNAAVVVEGGNLTCSDEACEELARRGVPVLPGIVANCGAAAVTGLLLLGAAPRGIGLDDLVEWLFHEVSVRIRNNIRELLTRSASDPRPLTRIAADIAAERLAARREQELVSV